jgi:hypothetical protein
MQLPPSKEQSDWYIRKIVKKYTKLVELEEVRGRQRMREAKVTGSNAKAGDLDVHQPYSTKLLHFTSSKQTLQFGGI